MKKIAKSRQEKSGTRGINVVRLPRQTDERRPMEDGHDKDESRSRVGSGELRLLLGFFFRNSADFSEFTDINEFCDICEFPDIYL